MTTKKFMQRNLWRCLMNKCTYFRKVFSAYSGMIARFPKFRSYFFLSVLSVQSPKLFFALNPLLDRKTEKFDIWFFSNLLGQFITRQLDGVTTFWFLHLVVLLQLTFFVYFFLNKVLTAPKIPISRNIMERLFLLYEFIVTLPFSSNVMFLHFLKHVFRKKPLFLVPYLHNNNKD